MAKDLWTGRKKIQQWLESNSTAQFKGRGAYSAALPNNVESCLTTIMSTQVPEAWESFRGFRKRQETVFAEEQLREACTSAQAAVILSNVLNGGQLVAMARATTDAAVLHLGDIVHANVDSTPFETYLASPFSALLDGRAYDIANRKAVCMPTFMRIIGAATVYMGSEAIEYDHLDTEDEALNAAYMRT